MELFSGSYDPQDVGFLLKVVPIETIGIAEKERLIQQGTHYSEMLSNEESPSPEYLKMFDLALSMNIQKMARHVADLAVTLADRPGREIVLVSLARAGTPVGVLLHRALAFLGRRSVHYCVSIIRERGIDWNALDYICERHAAADLVFVDGWTGKGGISAELHQSVSAYNESRCTSIDSSLWVLSDLCGWAAVAATCEDYLIPHAVLNSTVSGLIGRTVLNSRYVQEGDFHACAFYKEKSGEDRSKAYVDAFTLHLLAALPLAGKAEWSGSIRKELQAASDQFVSTMMERYGAKKNNVKPGIGESTRAMLRRVPERLIVRSRDAANVQHLVYLAEQSEAVIEEVPAMPYQAAVIIKPVSK